MFFLLGWEWSMMGKEIDVGMRLQWAASWHLLCKLLSIGTTGQYVAGKSSRNTYSEFSSESWIKCTLMEHIIRSDITPPQLVFALY